MSSRTWLDVKPSLDGAALLPEAVRGAGYATFATGKWHNGEPSFGRDGFLASFSRRPRLYGRKG